METQIKQLKKRKKTHVIFCNHCGKKRQVETANWKQVKLCVECYYKKRRQYNTAFIKKRREQNKKHAK